MAYNDNDDYIDNSPIVDESPEGELVDEPTSSSVENTFDPRAGAISRAINGAKIGYEIGRNGLPHDLAKGVGAKPAENPAFNSKKEDKLKNRIPNKDDNQTQNQENNPATETAKPKEESKKKNDGLSGNNSSKKSSLNPISRLGNRLSNLSPISKARNVLSKVGLGGKEGLSEKDDKDDSESDDKEKDSSSSSKDSKTNSISIGKFKISIPVLSLYGVMLGVLLLIVLFIALFTVFEEDDSGNMCYDPGSGGVEGTYTGSGDVLEFMCKMQNPLAHESVYTILSYAGEDRGDHIHGGVDMATYGNANSPIYAAQSGKVIETHDGCERTESGGTCGGSMGNHVIIDHGGIKTIYMHMVKGSVKPKVGEKVGKGQYIGNVGSTGNSYGEHLHFEMRLTNSSEVVTAINDYFRDTKKFKKSCGSSWDGELAGDSANQANDTSSEYVYTGSSSSNTQCCTEMSSKSNSSYCPDGVTVKATDEGAGGTFELEDYIAKVTTRENGGAGYEALKAQAIAARTYLVNTTNNCKRPIANSQGSQTMASEATENAKKATNETAGQVMLYNGEVMFSEYSNFLGTCSGDTCTSTFTRQPSGEKATFTIPISFYTGNGGHGRGMSQNGADYMASQGKTYDEILRFFYDDDIEITGASSSSCGLGGNGTFKGGKIWDYNQFDYKDAYCGGTIADSGCGPTAMAIVVSTMLNEEHKPSDLAKASSVCSTDSHDYFIEAAKKYNLKAVSTKEHDEVLTALNRGDSLVIANVTNKTVDGKDNFWTSDGHYIVLAGHSGSDVWVQDPHKGSDGRTNNKGDGVYNFEKYIVPAATLGYVIITMN